MTTFIRICPIILVKKQNKLHKQTNSRTQNKPCGNLPVKIVLGNLSYDLPLPRDRGDTSLQGHEHAAMLLQDFTIRFNIQIIEQTQITQIHI